MDVARYGLADGSFRHGHRDPTTLRWEHSMLTPPQPLDEARRLAALRALDLLDSLPEERFDRITRLARRLFNVPIALVSLVDAERQWFKSRQGLDVPQTHRDISFCGHAVAGGALLVVDDALDDERFSDNPLVVGDPSIRFYAGCPVYAGGGFAVGTLCLIDRQPHSLGAEEVALLRDLAAMIEDEFGALQQATTDPLTGIANRRGLEALAGRSLALSRRLGAPATLLLFDLDGFKPINDELGHAAGDRALVDFAESLVETFREADVIARLGGDEFCVLACGPQIEMASPLARLEANLAALSDRPYRIAFSVGAVEYDPRRHGSIAELIAAADQAMYEVKPSRQAPAIAAVG